MPLVDVRSRCDEIQNLIGNNEITQALLRLMDFAREFTDDKAILHDAIVLKAGYKDLERNLIQLERGQYTVERNRIIRQALSVVDHIFDHASVSA